MTHILDDFFMVSPIVSQCQNDLLKFMDMCSDINVPMAPEKTIGLATVINFMGYEIDSILSEVHLPQDKLDKCTEAISSLLEGSKTTLRKLQSVIGLGHWSLTFVILPLQFRCKEEPL